MHLHGETFKFWSIIWKNSMKILNSMVFALSLRPCHSPFSLGNVSTPYIYAIKYSIFHTDKMHAWLWFIFLFAPLAALQKRRQGAEEDEERKKRSHTLNAVTIKRGNSNANWIYLPEISFSIVHLSEFLALSLSRSKIDQFEAGNEKNMHRMHTKARKMQTNPILPFAAVTHPFPFYLFVHLLQANLYPPTRFIPDKT